jgi:hypothetical protein
VKQNPKSEYRKKPRGPKQTETLEAESEKWKSETIRFGILCFSITWICFEFRISSFEFFLCHSFLGAPFDLAQGMLCTFARATVFPIPFLAQDNFKHLWLVVTSGSYSIGACWSRTRTIEIRVKIDVILSSLIAFLLRMIFALSAGR